MSLVIIYVHRNLHVYSYDMPICYFSPATFRDFDNHYYFTAWHSLIWNLYIIDVPWQDRNWFKAIMVVDGEWEGDIDQLRVKSTPTVDPQLSNELEDIGVYRP
ncbi:hypothetical protein PS1_038261 [Malus domestica]